MDTFSTFDVARIFHIDRTRLQTWLDKGFFYSVLLINLRTVKAEVDELLRA